ncbi:hypothetical protein F511_11545 [Dorcoceras hygrometricum]|uniref:Uncharacterized protein n=1 Tax=Dorcoceras hygrometricum TaxID=472368 RepID=A0A2Z7ABU5_9LAMI|nr:hypothetical protein F511_11545 [Dorcoceras hygrometricum]
MGSMAHVAQIIAQPFARPAAHCRPPPGQCLRITVTNRATSCAWAAARNSAAMEACADSGAYTSHRLALRRAITHETAAIGWPKQRPTLGRQARKARFDRVHICGGRLRQSGPRPEVRLLALEGLTRSAWTDSPRQVGRNKFRRSKAAAAAAAQGGGGGF